MYFLKRSKVVVIQYMHGWKNEKRPNYVIRCCLVTVMGKSDTHIFICRRKQLLKNCGRFKERICSDWKNHCVLLILLTNIQSLKTNFKNFFSFNKNLWLCLNFENWLLTCQENVTQKYNFSWTILIIATLQWTVKKFTNRIDLSNELKLTLSRPHLLVLAFFWLLLHLQEYDLWWAAHDQLKIETRTNMNHFLVTKKAGCLFTLSFNNLDHTCTHDFVQQMLILENRC